MSAKKPNIEQIRRYLNGELNAKAMHKLEREAHADPFLWDVIKGMESAEGKHQHNLDAINRLINQRVEKDKKRIIPMWKVIPVAASLLIALGIGGWWLSHYPDKVTVAVSIPRIAQPDKVKVQSAPAERTVPQFKPPIIARLNHNRSASPVLKPEQEQVEAAVSAKADTADHKDMAYMSTINTPQLKQVSIFGGVAEKKADAALANPAVIDIKGYTQANRLKAQDTLSRLLIGRAEGVRLNDGYLGNNIAIRGSSSLLKGPEPLYVIDGTPVENYKPGLIKPDDIRSINVLKDSEATALYGSRASNGVVVVNTRNGFKAASGTDKISSANAKAFNNGNDTALSQMFKNKHIADNHSDLASKAISAGKASRVTGRVFDKESHEPLPGVSVMIDGTGIGTQTDMNGRFIINLPTGKQELKIAYIGYNTQQLKAKNSDSLNVNLSPADRSLAEVAVIGYGTVKKHEDADVESAHPAHGWKAYNKYLKENAIMPDGRIGTVKLAFTVGSNGSTSNIIIIKGLSEDMNKKAIQLIQDGPAWTPQSDGKPQQISQKIKFHK